MYLKCRRNPAFFLFYFPTSIPSNSAIIRTASSRDWPQISGSGWKAPQMRGRSGRPKILQRKSSARFTQRTPAGLPLGIPGRGELIDITVQQAAQLGRHSINERYKFFRTGKKQSYLYIIVFPLIYYSFRWPLLAVFVFSAVVVHLVR